MVEHIKNWAYCSASFIWFFICYIIYIIYYKSRLYKTSSPFESNHSGKVISGTSALKYRVNTAAYPYRNSDLVTTFSFLELKTFWIRLYLVSKDSFWIFRSSMIFWGRIESRDSGQNSRATKWLKKLKLPKILWGKFFRPSLLRNRLVKLKYKAK